MLELVPTPPELLTLILAITVSYLVATGLNKRVFWRLSARTAKLSNWSTMTARPSGRIAR